MAATSKEVARLAGVSQPTVSRALRGDRRITPATVQRVMRAAAQLGYVPSNVARSLATRSTKRVAVVAAELTNPFYPELIAPLHDALERAGLGTILVTDRGGAEVDYAPLFDGSVDGVVLTAGSVGSDLPARLRSRGMPVVLANRSVGLVAGGPETDEVVPDNAVGARSVAELLVSGGHRRVACISGPENTSTARERESAYRSALAEHGVVLTSSLTVRGAFAHETGHSGFATLMTADEPPTAVFCANDVIAIGALNSASGLGVVVPGDVSLIGFDNIPAAAWELIGLTTVDVDLTSMAAQATDLLLSRIADPDRPPVRRTIPTRLILRGTHGPASPR
jgi:LacI family transcriptional regulator